MLLNNKVFCVIFFFVFLSCQFGVIKLPATHPRPHLPVTSRAPRAPGSPSPGLPGLPLVQVNLIFNIYNILLFADKMGSNATKSQKIVSGTEDNSMALFNLQFTMV